GACPAAAVGGLRRSGVRVPGGDLAEPHPQPAVLADLAVEADDAGEDGAVAVGDQRAQATGAEGRARARQGDIVH
ncbi:MAG: hypothetical protein OXE81_07040, partial [Gammaproteobacteria bacterium]|nr:hypothetical protein [Gammaproteobacteria bacterium]